MGYNFGWKNVISPLFFSLWDLCMIGFIYLIILVLKFLRTLYDGLTALGSIHSARACAHTHNF